ncbi:MAG: DUF2851 family protein [Candidatus Delongbacteria bacterium]|nr:DUF2851 family protein [Candidatus Delongbacteria bacterium]
MSELEFHRVWDQASFHSDGWVTCSGFPLEIIYPGTYSHGEGPDFRYARLWINHHLIVTDIEIELRAENWYHHRHHLNSAYQNVRLVVVMEQPVGPARLEHSLSNEPIEILWWPEPDSIPPETGFLSGVICPLNQSDHAPEETLIRLGWKRLEAKFSRFRIRYGNDKVFDELIYQGMMEGLGYTRNQDAFLRLSSYLNLDLICRVITAAPHEIRPFVLQAVLFRVSGWEDQINRQAPAYMNYLRDSLARAGLKMQLPVLDLHWKLARTRPFSHPVSRMVYISFWLSQVLPEGLTEFILSRFYQPEGGLRSRLCRALRPELSPTQRHMLSGCYYRLPDGLIGRPRIDILVFNVIMPLLWIFFSQEGMNRHRDQVVKEIEDYPLLSDNFPQSLVLERWNRLHHPGIRIRHAIQQQGLIYIYHQFCRQGHCEKCRIGS